MLYQRSNTVSGIPTDLIPEVDEDMPTERARLIACKVGDSPTLHRSNSLEGDNLVHSDDDDDETRPLDASSNSTAGMSIHRSGNRVKRTRFQVQRSVSINEPPVTAYDRGEVEMVKPKRLNGGRGYGRGQHVKSPSASNLLNKVKERIREKVFQSSEWPNAAAIMHEKRMRANDALNASLSSRKEFEALQTAHPAKKKNHFRSKTMGAESAVKYEVVIPNNDNEEPLPGDIRTAFIRRRSISEDTYDRQPCANMKQEVKQAHLVGSVQTEAKWFGSRLMKRSPRPMKKHMRAVSLDSAKMQKVGLETQGSVESSSSTVSSVRTMDSVGSSVASVRIDSDMMATAGPSQVLPELVLDDKAKETIMEVTTEEDEEDSDEYDEDGKKKTKPVPEVVFDEHGQTWDVYGAEFDPEILGHAIQKHLEKLMVRKIAEHQRAMSMQVTSSCQQEVNKEKDSASSKSTESSFWLRLLCLFRGRGEITG